MNFEIILDLITNMVLLMSTAIIYSLFSEKSTLSPFVKKIILGFSVSIVGILIMRNHVLLEQGLVFDGRSIVMLLSSFYFGIIPAIIGVIALGSYRYYLTLLYSTNAGFIPGLLWIIIPALIGLVWRFLRFRKSKDHSYVPSIEQYLVIILTQALMISILFLFPKQVSVDSISKVAPTLIIIYPIGGFFVSSFMLKLRKNFFMKQEIIKQQEEYSELLNSMSYSNFMIDVDTQYIINANQSAIKLYGYSLEEFKRLKTTDISIYGSLELKNLLNAENESLTDYFISKHKTKNGEIISVEIRKKTQSIQGKNYIIANVVDITQKLLDEQAFNDVNEKLIATLKSVNEAIFVIDSIGQIELINDVGLNYIQTYKYKNAQITDILSLDSNTSIDMKKIIQFVTTNGTPYTSDNPISILDKSAIKHIVTISVSPIKYLNKEVSGAIVIFNDITRQDKEHQQIEFISQHDHFTGLYNRYFFDAELNRLNTKRQLPISIIMGDINGLKTINDTFGHIEGDNYIKEISSILKQATRSEDIVARWGGDEFVILLPQTPHKDAIIIIDRIKDLCLKSRYSVVTPSISLGLSTKTKEENDINSVLLEAEEEMYDNKQYEGKIVRKELLHNIYETIHSLHPDLKQHAIRVMNESKNFGTYLSLPKEEIKTLLSYAHHHDIGWIKAANMSFDTSKKLIDHDLSFASKFPEIAYRIAKSIPELSHIAPFLEAHQEHFDGSGFPNKLKHEEIPYLTRVLQIIDFVDVCQTKNYSINKIFDLLMSEKNIKFDPDLVSKYIEYKKEEM
jgi:diguanylate cyclase (GGDEF)-like protein/PAS domain S-box-containing protein